MNDFREHGLDPSRPMDLETFIKWIYRDHNLRLTYTIKNVVIATSLIGLDNLGFEDNLNVNVNPSGPGILRYPSFK